MKMLKQKIASFKRTDKGSVLVFTLLITGLMLATAISLITVSSIERKTSGSSSKSTQSFQVADSAVEVVIRKIKDSAPDDTLNNLGGSCDTGIVTMTLPNGSATLTLYGDTETSDANKITSCSAKLSTVQKVKSVGTYAGTSRAIEALAGDGECIGGTTLIVSSSNNSFSDSEWIKIKDFIDEEKGVISSARCLDGGRTKLYFPTEVTIGDSSDKGKYIEISRGDSSSDSIDCGGQVAPNQCELSASPCNGGWAIYGSCTCSDNNCPL